MKIRNVFLTACIMLTFWGLASLIDVNAKNMSARNYTPWNAFALAAGREPERSWRPQVPEEAGRSEGEETMKPDKLHTEENVMLLARLIEAENGSAAHDETLVLTGVCALKRVKSPHYPDTLRGVIHQEGGGGRAYSTAPGLDGVRPSERALEIAEELLVYGVDEYPDGLVFQAMFPQGARTYKRLDGEYFCLSK